MYLNSITINNNKLEIISTTIHDFFFYIKKKFLYLIINLTNLD